MAAAPTAQDIARACRVLRLDPADGAQTSFLPSLSRSSSQNSLGGIGLPSISSRPGSAAAQRPGSAAVQRPGSATAQRPGSAAHLRPLSGVNAGGGAGGAAGLLRGGGSSFCRGGTAAGGGAAAAVRLSANGAGGGGSGAPALQLAARDLSTFAARAELAQHLRAFVAANELPASSPNFHSTEPDPVACFVALLGDRSGGCDAELVLVLLKTLKILSRKQDNRLAFGEDGVRAVLFTLAPPLTPAIAAEAANVLLNVCYEAENVQALLNTPATTFLVAFLADEDEDLQANAAGAIQSICFQAKGRAHVRQMDGIPALLDLLPHPNQKVVTRAIGAIHNISADAGSIRIIRTCGGIPHLVRLLRSEQLPISGSAAGALQNVSREVASRLIIRELDAVPPLAQLMSAPDVHAQVCAAGALLNIIGPDLPDTPQGVRKRLALGRIMSTLLAASMVFDAVYEMRPPLE